MQLTNQQAHNIIVQFKSIQKIKGVIVPLLSINKINKLLRQKGLTSHIPNTARVIHHSQQEKMILLKDNVKDEEVLPLINDIKDTKLGAIQLQFSYKNYENQQILNWFTKKEDPEMDGYVNFPNSFETIGHIAHYNLTEEQQPWKIPIGEITLLKCPNIKTVANKTQKLHNVYRTPTLEPMAGTKDYQASLKERGVQFKINFEKVYWCSRLQQERDRLLELMRPGEVLADLFCGVGPLAVRAAKKNMYVIANDLNPFCHEYLLKNSTLNKVDNRIISWNMCAREATKKIYSQNGNLPVQFRYPDHIYMNLPVDAIQFIDVLVNYDIKLKTKKMPLVHVNCFVVADSDEKSRQLLTARIQKVLPTFREDSIVQMHHIKNVTVIMRMYCISFRLPHSSKSQEQNLFDKEHNKQQEKIKGAKKVKAE